MTPVEIVAVLVGNAAIALTIAVWFYTQASAEQETLLEYINEQGFYNVDEYYEVAQDAQRALEGAYS